MKNKKIQKIMAFLLLCCSLGTTVGFAGCGQTSEAEENKNKTELKLGVFNGGYGYRWAELVAENFEKAYENVSFEEGKKGVWVNINPQKESFSVDSMEAAIKNEKNAEDIYYTAYHCALKFAKNGYALNINDAVYEKCYTDDGEIAEYDHSTGTYIGGTKSIYDKLYPIRQDSHYYTDQQLDGVLGTKMDGVADDLNGNGIADDAGFYALPYEDSLSGLIYDHDLFEEQGWLDYDGINGLPDTIEDFFDLMDRIVDANMTPYITGNIHYYMQEGFQDAFFAQYEGYDNAALCYTYDGEYTFAKSDLDNYLDPDILAEIKAEDYFEETEDGYKVQISAENAWLLTYQPSKRAWVEFMRKFTNPEYYDHCFHNSQNSYADAQRTFVWSKLNKNGQKRIAMIQEGEWWENEARAAFEYTGGYGSRDFRFFPLPEIPGQKTNDRSLGNFARGTDLFINAKTKKADLAKLFIQFAHSETSLEIFTLETSATRFFEYDLSDEQLATMTPFAQDVYKIKKTDTSGVTVVSAKDATEEHPFHLTEMAMGGMGTYIRIFAPNTTQTIWENTFGMFLKRSGAQGTTYLSAADFLDGMYRYFSKERWEAAYRSF